MEAPRPRMRLYALFSLPRPGVKGSGKVVTKRKVAGGQAPCLENGKCLLHHHYHAEVRLKGEIFSLGNFQA